MMRNGGRDARCAHSIRFTDQHAADIWSRRREEHSFTCGSWTEDTFTTGFITSPSHRWRPLPPTLTPSSPITLFSLCYSCVLTCSLFILHPEIILLPHHNSPHICHLSLSLNCVPNEHRSHHWDIFQFFSDAAVLWLIYLSLCLRNLFTFKSWLKMVSMIHGSYLGTGSFKIVQLFSFLPNANRGPEQKHPRWIEQNEFLCSIDSFSKPAWKKTIFWELVHVVCPKDPYPPQRLVQMKS